jgi:phage replication O-like protein O
MNARTPQLEDGYVRIANELLEALLAARLTANQWKVVMTIIRKTYGYGKKEDDVSASQIASMCAMNRTHVTETLNQLARMNIISKRPGIHGSIVAIQKDSRHWVADEKLDDGTPKRIIVKTADKHYTYRVTLPATGEFYLGVRSCKCHPNQDRYVGSGNWISTVEKGELVKEVIQIFDNRQDAERAEVALIRQYAGNALLRNSTCYVSGAAFDVDLSELCPPRTESVQGVQESDFTRTDSGQVDRTDSVHTKDNLPKDNLQKTGPTASRVDPLQSIPTGTLVDLYHELMPNNPRVKVINPGRKSAIRARWLEAAKLDFEPFGYTTREGGLEAWRQFFAVCAESKFLTGLSPPAPGKPAFIADIDFLFSPSGFAKTLENKYHRDAP